MHRTSCLSVTVGVRGSFYDPPTTNALESDTVTFIFGGISALLGTNGSTDIEAPTWSIIISNASEPIWFFCEATKPQSHCAAGMVGAINAPSDQFLQFQSAAKAVTGTPAPSPTLILTGIGAFATASPTTISLSPSSASALFSSLSSSSDTLPAPSSSSSEESSSNGVSVGAVAGGVAAGIVALVVIVLLLFLLYRQRNKRARDEDGFTTEKERTPSTPLFKRGISDSVADSDFSDSETSRAGSGMRRQASSSAFSSNMESMDRAAQRQPTSRTVGSNHQRGFSEVTMEDAFTMLPTRHPYAQTQNTQEAPSPSSAAPNRSAVNVHEIAKEVATLLRSGKTLPPGIITPPVVGPRLSHTRSARQLPNPAHYLRPESVPEEPESPALPRYER
ncbi:hypothetical protein ACEPAF_7525 [Sanghuangporus sanghuang]|uniref:Uncharacterized protein n=1 Tax=Sanghuangporus baumii TaxID=108892 RepID=A0A9Q5HW28_SANBA|nr:hypothetical protein A7U60_g6104 [Sanghuangporus baumii]